MNEIASVIAKMTSREIADLVGSRHDSVKRAIDRLAERGVIELPPTVEIQTATQPTKAYVFDHAHKRDSFVVVAQLSPEFTARLVDRWQELESKLAKAPTLQIISPIEADLRGVAFIAESMRLPDSGKLGMFTKYCQANAPQLLPSLPAYAVDAPPDNNTGSSEPTLPITEIVRGMTSAAKANKALSQAGLLEQKTRRARNGSEKRYWSITESGLLYGKNITSPSNPKETQPHWYQCKANQIKQIISGGVAQNIS